MTDGWTEAELNRTRKEAPAKGILIGMSVTALVAFGIWLARAIARRIF